MIRKLRHHSSSIRRRGGLLVYIRRATVAEINPGESRIRHGSSTRASLPSSPAQKENAAWLAVSVRRRHTGTPR